MSNSQNNCAISICNPVVSNIGSLKTFFLKNGINYHIVNVGEQVKTKSLLICGVSGLHFSDQKQFHDFKNWIISIRKLNKQIVGICAGMQMLFSVTDEVEQDMLNILPGKIQKLHFKNPEITTYIGKRSISYNNSEMSPYFSHGYGLVCDIKDQFDESIEVNSNENEKFIAFFSKENLLGFQFHPERSCEITMQFFINKLKLGYEN